MTRKPRDTKRADDEGVSPVIAVILMVAITVVLAATVYVWVSGFATEDTGPEQAAATAQGVDLNDDGDVEWIQLTLSSGENAPYPEEDVSYSATSPNGTALDEDHLCVTAQATPGNWECQAGEKFLSPLTVDEWEVGGNLWIPCQEDEMPDQSGPHLVTVSIRDSTVLDTSVECEEVA